MLPTVFKIALEFGKQKNIF